MALLSLDVNCWNLSAVLVTALAAGCGPAIQLDDAGETEGVGDTGDDGDDDGTVPPGGECQLDTDCANGASCIDNVCVGNNTDDDSCSDYGCYDDDSYYNDDYYSDDYYSDDAYYEGNCNVDADCSPSELCVRGGGPGDYGYQGLCEPMPSVSECGAGAAPEFVPLPIDIAGDGDVVALAFVHADADGREDLVVSRESGATLYLGPGDQPGIPLPVPLGLVQDATSADLNGDLVMDIAVALESGGVAVLLGDGLGSFTAGAHIVEKSTSAVEIVALDFDGNGTMDLVTAGSELRLHPSDGTGGFGPVNTLSSDTEHVALTFPVDQSPTLLGAQWQFVLEWQTGAGADDQPDGSPYAHKAIESWLPLSTGPDALPALLVVGDAVDSTVLELRTYQSTGRYAESGRFIDGAAGDMRGDGRHDFVLVNEVGQLVYFGHNSEGALDCQLTYELGGPVNAVASGDMDGDGRSELVTVRGGLVTVFAAE